MFCLGTLFIKNLRNVQDIIRIKEKLLKSAPLWGLLKKPQIVIVGGEPAKVLPFAINCTIQNSKFNI